MASPHAVRGVTRELFGSSPIHLRFYARLRALVVAVVVVDVVAAVFARYAFDDIKPVDHFWDALQWSTQQLLSGGSSLQPDNHGLRWLEIFLQLVCLTAVAALAGSFAAFFHRQDWKHAPPAPASETEKG